MQSLVDRALLILCCLRNTRRTVAADTAQLGGWPFSSRGSQ